MKQRWRCLVCGYITEGSETPEACPVCGADGSQFAPIGRGSLRFLRDVYETFLPHAVAAHFPNGVLPAAVLFLVLGLVIQDPHLERTAFHLLVVSVLAVPVSFATGVYDWKHRYKGLKVPVFYRKMMLSSGLFGLGVMALALRAPQPDLLHRGGLRLWAYVGLVFSMLGVAVFLGHFGGKLVFYWRKR